MITAQALSDRLDGKPHNGYFQAKCPAHDDSRASLTITPGENGKTLIHCHAGCDNTDILAKLGLTLADIMGEKLATNGHKPAGIEKVYQYRDLAGNVRYEIVRKVPKTFLQRHPDGNGGYIYNMDDIEPVPYKLPELMAGLKAGKTICICEGEKDVDALASIGIIATTNHGGAGKWYDKLNSYFADENADIVIIPDNDDPGRRHVQKVATALNGIAKRIRILELPGLREKGDVSDWIAAGGTPETLAKLTENAHDWTPDLLLQPTKPDDSNPKSSENSKFTLIHADALAELPPITYELDGELIPAGGISVIYGPSGSGKSFFALDCALRIAQDKPVVYIAAEGQRGYADRVAAWCKFNHQGSGRLYFLNDTVNLLEDDDIQAFESAIGETKPALIFVDTLARCLIGGDENSSRDMGNMIDACNKIQRTTGAAIVLIHHTGKSGASERGSSALRGAADSMIEMNSDDGLIAVTSSKEKDGPGFEPRYFKLIETDARPGQRSCVLMPADRVIQTRNDRLSPQQRTVLETLSMEVFRETGAKWSQIASAAKIPEGSVGRVLSALKRLGYVSQGAKGDPFTIKPEGLSVLKLNELSERARQHDDQLSVLS